jgi:hypothetical protein
MGRLCGRLGQSPYVTVTIALVKENRITKLQVLSLCEISVGQFIFSKPLLPSTLLYTEGILLSDMLTRCLHTPFYGLFNITRPHR